MTFERDNIRRMKGYTYGEQPDDPQVIKLNTNENPYPPSPLVGEAIAAFDYASLRRYPPATANGFRQLVADEFDIDIEQIVVTNGGDEALRLALTTFVEPGGTFGMAEPSYSLYPVLANVHGARIERVPLDQDFRPPPDFIDQLNAVESELTCLVNPHAPSGTLLDAATIDAYAEAHDGVLLVDEAYVDFVDPELCHNLVPLIDKHANLLLLRTLSKGYSLAGLRFGFLMGARGLIDPIVGKTRDSYNIDGISQQIAGAAFADQTYATETWHRVRVERDRLRRALAQLGLPSRPSQANFLLVAVGQRYPQGAARLQDQLRDSGILVRYFATPPLDRLLRITIGTPAENQRLIGVLEKLAE